MSSNELTLNIGQVIVQVKKFAAPLAIEATAPPPQHGGPPSVLRRTPPPHGGTPELVSIELPIERSQDKPSSQRARDAIFDTLADLGKINPKMNRASAGKLAKAKALILESCPDVTPDEIRRRADAYRREHPTWTFTPMALATNWDTLGSQGSQDTRQQILAGLP
jgi:hypothetical protein